MDVIISSAPMIQKYMVKAETVPYMAKTPVRQEATVRVMIPHIRMVLFMSDADFKPTLHLKIIGTTPRINGKRQSPIMKGEYTP